MANWHQGTRGWLTRLARSRRGGSMILMGLSLPLLVGCLALGVEVGVIYIEKRQVQTQTDAAALAAGYELAKGNETTLQAIATKEAYRNGLDSKLSPTIVVNRPPKDGAYKGNASAVEVLVTIKQSPMFSALFRSDSTSIAARAVALVRIKANACVLSTSPTASNATNVSGSGTVKLNDCALASNSTTANAINLSGDSTLKADTMWTPGRYQKSSNATMDLKSVPVTQAWKVEDPYEGLTIPSIGSCDYSNVKVGTDPVTTLSPGVYCGGIKMSSSGKVRLKPGTYYIDGGDFEISGQVKDECQCNSPTDGVTIVLTNTKNPANTGKANISGGTSVDLRAPTSNLYPYPGVLFYQDQRISKAGFSQFVGGSNVKLTGALYFPGQEVKFAGNNTAASTHCLLVFGKTIDFTGETNLMNDGCADAGIKTATLEGVYLVE